MATSSHDQLYRKRTDGHAIDPIIDASPSDVVMRRNVAWRGMAAEVIHCTGQGRKELRFRAPRHLLIAYEAGDRRDGDTFVEGLPRSALRKLAGKLTFVPACTEFCEWHDTRTPVRLLCIYFDHAELNSNDGWDIESALLPPRLFFEDATIWSTIIKLRKSLESQTNVDQRYGRALGFVLVHELMRLNRAPSRIDDLTRGGLAAWQQRIVAMHIDEHLNEQIALVTLADLVRLTPFHFCRAFKKSFGASPLRYHRDRRIERAKALLAEQGSSVIDTGLALGFSETSSFSAAFRKQTGLTPTAYRRSFV